MYRRKIQLIAGTTYSVSLPKEWVKKNNLKEKNEILMNEKNDRTLVISPTLIEGKTLNEITLNVDEYINNVDQILFAIYYLGVETITLFSKKGLTKDTRSRIRKTLADMSGSEISYEDENKITIKVLLDKSKVNITQILYRISLIIGLTVSNMLDQLDIKEIRLNENEIDRLYHLMTKIVSSSLIDSNVLHSSNINNVSLIPSYFLIGKRLENIGDSLYNIAEHIYKINMDFECKREILNFIKLQINRSMKHIISNFPSIFEKTPHESIDKIKKQIYKIKDQAVQDFLIEAVRFIINIEEEVVNLSFYKKLIKENYL